MNNCETFDIIDMFKTLDQSEKLGEQDCKCVLGVFWIIMNKEVSTQQEYQDYGAMDSSTTWNQRPKQYAFQEIQVLPY